MASHNDDHAHGPTVTNPNQAAPLPPPPGCSHHVLNMTGPLPAYSPPKKSKSRCCCVSTLIIALLLLCAAAVAIAFYFLVILKSPQLDVLSISFSDESTSMPPSALTALSLSDFQPEDNVSSAITVTLFANNLHRHLGMSLSHKHSHMWLSYGDVELGEGIFPGCDLPQMSEMMLDTASLTRADMSGITGLENAEALGQVPLVLKFRAPIRYKVGAIKTWNFIAKVNCRFTVNHLTGDSKILSQQCRFGVHLW